MAPEVMVAAAAVKAHWKKKVFQLEKAASWSPLARKKKPSPANSPDKELESLVP